MSRNLVITCVLVHTQGLLKVFSLRTNIRFVSNTQRKRQKMKAFEWIDRVKTARGIDSDYAAAKLLGLSKQAISTYRTRLSTLDENASITVAEALGMKPAGVILDQAAERVKSPEVRSALLAEARRLCILC